MLKDLSLKLLFSLICLFSLPVDAQRYDISPNELWDSVNDGWGGVYGNLDAQLNPNKNYIIWSIIAPKVPLDLRTPDFFKQVISTASTKEALSISHNLVAWRCDTPQGFFRGATGHSGETEGQSTQMVKAGWGLTTFLSTFTDGWLSGGSHTGFIFSERARKEEIYSVVVEVSANECTNMLQFLKKFITHPNRPYENFGLTLNPEKFEGAGCISFAESLLKRAGILTDLFNVSERSLWASHYRFGGNDLQTPINTSVPRISWREGEQKKVSINEFFTANWNAGTKGVNLKLLDPELLVWGVKNLSPNLSQKPRVVFTETQRSCGSGQVCGGRHVKINDKFDKKAQAASQQARAWKRSMESRGYRMSELTVEDEPFLIFERR